MQNYISNQYNPAQPDRKFVCWNKNEKIVIVFVKSS